MSPCLSFPLCKIVTLISTWRGVGYYVVRNKLAMTYEIVVSAYGAVRMCVEAEFIEDY